MDSSGKKQPSLQSWGELQTETLDLVIPREWEITSDYKFKDSGLKRPGGQIKTMCSNYTMEQYLVIKRSKALIPDDMTQINLENMMLSERSHAKRTTMCDSKAHPELLVVVRE